MLKKVNYFKLFNFYYSLVKQITLTSNQNL